MKKLPLEINKKGFVYTQIKRVKDVAIYKQKNLDIAVKSEWFEVIKIKSHNGMTLGGNYIPPSEMYPSSTQWGVSGFTYQNQKDAEAKFKEILSDK
jgi:hypothetical protein